MAGTLTPERTAARLCELSSDARAAVLLDAAGALAGSSESDRERAEALARLTRELFETVDRATRDWDADPAEQIEVQISGGAAYASRTPRWTLAVVARRGALSSLMLYDLRAVLGELEGGPPIRVAAAADARGAESATEEDAAGDLPLPELGRDIDDEEATSAGRNARRRRAGGSARRARRAPRRKDAS
jgi:predicted regulator of Ras-like GTPase activity (Roadblock/LC7/MglB family)